METYKLSISKAVELIHSGALTPSELLEALIKRIELLEPHLEAWVTIDEEGARLQAERLTAEAEDGHFRGALHGIPVGVKDIYYTSGVRTTMGSPFYGDFVPEVDAASVRLLKEAGAVMLGKTETTEFAQADPAPTRNPWNLEHTPGGSSSGSAAAVSSGMCQAALGSQTGGSVIRPASFCGVVGVKPTYGLISKQGVYPLAWSLDHVGFFTRSVEDAALMRSVLARNEYERPREMDGPPRLGVLRSYFHEMAHEEVWRGHEQALDVLRDNGAEVVDVPLPDVFDVVPAAHRVIMASEAASVHEERFRRDRQGYRRNIRAMIASGLMVHASTYLRALRIRGRFSDSMRASMEGFDCLVTPSTTTPALRGLESTGNPAFNAPWSFCGFPTITVPSGLTRDGLPLGLQLIDLPLNESHMLGVAGWCEGVLGFPKEPHEPL